MEKEKKKRIRLVIADNMFTYSGMLQHILVKEGTD